MTDMNLLEKYKTNFHHELTPQQLELLNEKRMQEYYWNYKQVHSYVKTRKIALDFIHDVIKLTPFSTNHSSKSDLFRPVWYRFIVLIREDWQMGNIERESKNLYKTNDDWKEMELTWKQYIDKKYGERPEIKARRKQQHEDRNEKRRISEE